MRGVSSLVARRTLARSSCAVAMSTALMRLTSSLSQVANEALERPVEQLGALPLHEVTRALHDVWPDELGEGDFAHLWEVTPDDVVVGPVQRERGNRAHLEEA